MSKVYGWILLAALSWLAATGCQAGCGGSMPKGDEIQDVLAGVLELGPENEEERAARLQLRDELQRALRGQCAALFFCIAPRQKAEEFCEHVYLGDGFNIEPTCAALATEYLSCIASDFLCGVTVELPRCDYIAKDYGSKCDVAAIDAALQKVQEVRLPPETHDLWERTCARLERCEEPTPESCDKMAFVTGWNLRPGEACHSRIVARAECMERFTSCSDLSTACAEHFAEVSERCY